jgi:hypothetical protein
VGEGQLGALLVGVERVDRVDDRQVRAALVDQHLTDQHAADLPGGVLAAALDRAIEGGLGDEHRQLLRHRRPRLLLEVGLVDRPHVE